MLMRGGTSKGAYFCSRDLPDDPGRRDDLVLRIVGSPDPAPDRRHRWSPCAHHQGGGGRPGGPDSGADVDYLFLQPSVDEPLVSGAQNCGNMLAGVGPFAVERGLVAVAGAEARVRIHMVNTGSVATATFPLRDGVPDYSGPASIDGVPGTAAATRLDFEDVAGSSCGALLPTGRLVDSVDGGGLHPRRQRDASGGDEERATSASAGYEDCATLEADAALRTRLEDVRVAAGRLMGLGDVTASTVPKMTLVAPPRTSAGDICTRTFIPHRCHEAIGVFGAVSVATAVVLPGAVGHEMLLAGAGGGPLRRRGPVRIDRMVTLEHPTGSFASRREADLPA